MCIFCRLPLEFVSCVSFIPPRPRYHKDVSVTLYKKNCPLTLHCSSQITQLTNSHPITYTIIHIYDFCVIIIRSIVCGSLNYFQTNLILKSVTSLRPNFSFTRGYKHESFS